MSDKPRGNRDGAAISVRGIVWIVALVVFVAALFQMSLPPFRDEAYLLSWGLDPAPGYYDHPPLTGWVSWAVLWVDSHLKIGHPIMTARGFALALGGISALLLHRRLVRLAPAGLATQLTLIWATIPGTFVFFSVYLNDLLVTFQVIVLILALHSLWRRSTASPVLIGVAAMFLAGLLLTKYSSAMIFLGLVAGLVWDRRGRHFLLARLLPVTLIASGAFLWHLWWNYQNCSVNLAFNFSFRHEVPTGGPVLAWVATLFLTTGSMAAQFLWRIGRGGLGRAGFFSRVFLGTLAVSAIIAILRGNFGGNWGAPFGGLAVLALAESRGRLSPVLALRTNLALLVFLVVPALLVTLALKTGTLSAGKYLPEMAAYRFNLLSDLGGDDLVDALERVAEGRGFGTDHYGITGLLRLHGLSPVVTLSRSVYGRNEDLFVDFSTLDGKDFIFLPLNVKRARNMATRYFADWREVRVTGGHGTYTLILADGFDYPAYRAEILETFVRDRYLASPFPYRACPVTRYLTSP